MSNCISHSFAQWAVIVTVTGSPTRNSGNHFLQLYYPKPLNLNDLSLTAGGRWKEMYSRIIYLTLLWVTQMILSSCITPCAKKGHACLKILHITDLLLLKCVNYSSTLIFLENCASYSSLIVFTINSFHPHYFEWMVVFFPLPPVFQNICLQYNKKAGMAWCTRSLYSSGRKPGFCTESASARYIYRLSWNM